MMIHLLIVASVVVAFNIEFAAAACGNPPVIWRNDNQTCPEHAVCADVFNTRRDWYNGTSCSETRVLSNCICPQNTVCPVHDNSHMLYSSVNHQLFFCEPVCEFPWCGDLEAAHDGFMGNSQMNNRPIAITTEQTSPLFGDKTYYRLSCRCPRNHFPVESSRRLDRAVTAYRSRYIRNENRYVTEYVCNIGQNDEPHDNPCPPANYN